MIPGSRLTGALIVLIFLLMFSQAIVQGQAQGDYTVSIGNASLTVTVRTVFLDNFTLNPNPSYVLALTGQNASQAQTAISSALASLVPGVRVAGLEITSSSAGNTTTTTVRFTVQGAATASQDAVRVNMAWKSFKVMDDIRVGNITLNLVGQYLATSPVLNNNSTSLIKWTYLVDGQPILTSRSVQEASAFRLLDFSRLSAPLQSWPSSFTLQGPSTTLSNNVKHNITAKQTTQEPTGPITAVFFAGYSHTVLISAPAVATVLGDTIIFSSGDSGAKTMAALTILFPTISLAAFLVERRLGVATKRWGKKRLGRTRRS